jgi:hypothetical protein
MDITPDFAVLAERWLAESRELAEGVPFTPAQRMSHEVMGRLLKRHGWLTPDGTCATGQGTIATPAAYVAAIRGTIAEYLSVLHGTIDQYGRRTS